MKLERQGSRKEVNQRCRKKSRKNQIPVPRQTKKEKKYSTALCISHGDENITKSQQHHVKKNTAMENGNHSSCLKAWHWKHSGMFNSDLSPLRASGTVNKDTLSDPVTCPKYVRSLHMQLLFLNTNQLMVEQHLIENIQEIE